MWSRIKKTQTKHKPRSLQTKPNFPNYLHNCKLPFEKRRKKTATTPTHHQQKLAAAAAAAAPFPKLTNKTNHPQLPASSPSFFFGPRPPPGAYLKINAAIPPFSRLFLSWWRWGGGQPPKNRSGLSRLKMRRPLLYGSWDHAAKRSWSDPDVTTAFSSVVSSPIFWPSAINIISVCVCVWCCEVFFFCFRGTINTQKHVIVEFAVSGTWHSVNIFTNWCCVVVVLINLRLWDQNVEISRICKLLFW